MKNNEITNTSQKRVLKIILLVLFSLIMPTIAGIIIEVNEVKSDASIYTIQFIVILIGCLLLLLIVKYSKFSFLEIGFRKAKCGKWIVGLFIVEFLAFSAGINLKFDINVLIALILFMIVVGLFEEIIYRGLILNYLKNKDSKKPIYISAIIFGIGHLANLASGAELATTILQVVFALLFGIVCAQIVYITESITIGVIWHILHNIIDQITLSPSMEVQYFIVIAQCIVLAIMAYILNKKI